MFTGIIESRGKISNIAESGTNRTFTIQSSVSCKLKVDQSISHDGVCLTVERCDALSHDVTLIKETLDRTNLGACQIGHELNLERCVKLSDRLDGHMVQGHVDSILRCINIIDNKGSWDFHFKLPDTYESLVVMKGSICINGISLTISELEKNLVGVSIIPYTYTETNMSSIKIGDSINVEFDILGKYVQRALQLGVYKEQ